MACQQAPHSFVTLRGDMGSTPSPARDLDYQERKQSAQELAQRAGNMEQAKTLTLSQATSITPMRKLLPRQRISSRKLAKAITKKQGRTSLDAISEAFEEVDWSERRDFRAIALSACAGEFRPHASALRCQARASDQAQAVAHRGGRLEVSGHSNARRW